MGAARLTNQRASSASTRLERFRMIVPFGVDHANLPVKHALLVRRMRNGKPSHNLWTDFHHLAFVAFQKALHFCRRL